MKERAYHMNKNLNIEIGNRLRELREEKSSSQADFIRKMELKNVLLTKSQYSRYESGETSIPVPYLKAFCDYFNVTTDYLINGTQILPDKEITGAINLLTSGEKKAVCHFMTAIANYMKEK